MILYHATPKSRVENIKEKGLLRGCVSNWNGMQMNNMLYFAFTPEITL